MALSRLQAPGGAPMRISDLAAASGMERPYLAKIIQALGARGLVDSRRGIHGGVTLARTPEAISLLEIVEAVEGPRWNQRCMIGFADCSDDRACPLHDFWRKERLAIHELLRRTTLAQTADFDKRHPIHPPG